MTSGLVTTSVVTSGRLTTSPITSGVVTTSPITSSEITSGAVTSQILPSSSTNDLVEGVGTNRKNNIIIAAASASGGVLMIGAVVLGVFLFKKRKHKPQEESLSVELEKPSAYSPLTESRSSINPPLLESKKGKRINNYIILDSFMKSNWRIPYEELQIEAELGSGSFGKVLNLCNNYTQGL